MESNDLTIQVSEKGYVNVRANLVLIHPQKGILFHTFPTWNGELTLFGGRVKLGESLKDACDRELEEELGLKLPIQKTWWEENIFVNTMTPKYDQCLFHEFSGFGVYYLPDGYDVDKIIEIDGIVHSHTWVDPQELENDIHTFFPAEIGKMIQAHVSI